MAKVLYEMSPIGENGAMEAIASLYFCSEECRSLVYPNSWYHFIPGDNDEYIEGTVCDECGDPLPAPERSKVSI